MNRIQFRFECKEIDLKFRISRNKCSCHFCLEIVKKLSFGGLKALRTENE